MHQRTSLLALIASSLLAACSAARKSGDAPAASPASEPSPPGSPGAYAQPAQPPSPEADAASTEPQPNAARGAFAPPPSRSLALSQASKDFEASQRELDVAAGDCRNACRALASMDRSAGRLCTLSQSDDEQHRCADAKNRVYSARTKVKDTCGFCPDVSVDRDAPIPSR